MENDVNKKQNKEVNTTSKEISRANIILWILEHKKHFILIVIGALITVSLFVYSVFFYNLFDYLRYGRAYRGALVQLSDNPPASLTRVADDIEIISVDALSYDGKYDFVAKIKNPNSNFVSNFSYCFTGSGVDLACSSSFILPDQEKYLILISQNLSDSPRDLNLQINNEVWTRLDFRKYPDWPAYYNERTNIVFDEALYERSSYDSGRGSLEMNSVYFEVNNLSPYNYWEVPLNIVMYNSGRIVGVSKFKILELKSRESREVNIRWPGSSLSVSNVEIYLDLDILNEGNYMQYR